MKETDFLSDVKIRQFKMIEEYELLMSMPNAVQRVVFETILAKYGNYYKSYDSVKQTFARLKRMYPERFNNKKQIV